ncbi:biosynthetic-type acetolactate synthase large subunit, partial [candidate division KSB1 bacterium]|nr:biosynthetic-type acetolactate synthase large subunit [candidate division KSB1 bacterium]
MPRWSHPQTPAQYSLPTGNIRKKTNGICCNRFNKSIWRTGAYYMKTELLKYTVRESDYAENFDKKVETQSEYTIMTGSEILVQSLLDEGVEIIFGYPGGVVLGLYDTLYKRPELNHILIRHEQGGTHAADGYARATGKPGVVLVTSGPGGTNTVTGIATAYMDSIPLVVITGQVISDNIGNDAFQEADIIGITRPITKHSFLVRDCNQLAQVIHEAFHIAVTGKPGPVLVDLPKDILNGKGKYKKQTILKINGYNPPSTGNSSQVEKAADLINKAKRPVIYSGGGVISGNASNELRILARKANIPVTTTLLGLGAFPESDPLSLGMLGMHGTWYANMAVNDCDLLIAVGTRFDDRVTGRVSAFAPKAKIIHVDVDPAAIGQNVKTHIPIVGDVRRVLRVLNQQVEETTHTEWLDEIEELRRKHPSLRLRDKPTLTMQYILKQLSDITQGKATIVTGVGQHQMWAALHYTFTEQNTLITSGGLGAMGFEIPAAMGAQIARPDALVWTIAGDGGFQMTLPELATMVENKIPVKIALMNNHVLGMVHQWQHLFSTPTFYATEYSGNPDF